MLSDLKDASPCVVDPCLPVSVTPFMTAPMGIVEQLLNLDQVKARFLLCQLDSAWTSPGYAEICC